MITQVSKQSLNYSFQVALVIELWCLFQQYKQIQMFYLNLFIYNL